MHAAGTTSTVDIHDALDGAYMLPGQLVSCHCCCDDDDRSSSSRNAKYAGYSLRTAQVRFSEYFSCRLQIKGSTSKCIKQLSLKNNGKPRDGAATVCGICDEDDRCVIIGSISGT